MAFVSNMDDEEKKADPSLAPQGAVAPVGGGGAVRLSPSSAVQSGGVGGAPGREPSSAGGQFASLNQYLAANQGQAEPLAGKLTAGIGQQYTALQGQNEAVLGDINRQVASNAVPANANDLIAQEAANPVSFASNESNIPSFQKLLTATYNGPASAEGTSQYQGQQAAINNAISQGQAATKTEAGRKGLLSQNEATPTAGVTALNSAILSQSPTALGSIEKAYDPFSSLVSGLSSGAQDVNKTISKTQNDASSANAAANRQIADQTQGLQSAIQGKLGKAQTDVNQYNQGLQGYQTTVAANQPFSAALQESNLLPLLGIANPFAQSYSALGTPTANSVATQDQLATQAALNKLSNGNLNILDPNAAVGGYTAPSSVPVAPDIAKLMDQLALADVAKNYVGFPGIYTAPTPTTGTDASRLLMTPGGTGGTNETAGWQNYQTQVSPFQKLMTQLNSIYGNQYVKPVNMNGKPINGMYELNS